MVRGPDKQFDPNVALRKAMELFWAKGYAATGLSELQASMGIGRKSLYDTFGNKRQLFIKAVQYYSDHVLGEALALLNRKGSPLGNVRRLMRSLQEANSEPGSIGCLLGVGMAQVNTEDKDLAEIMRRHLNGVEDAFYRAFLRAQKEGELKAETNVRDLARLFVGVVQGLALIGRVHETPAVPKSIVNGALSMLKKS